MKQKLLIFICILGILTLIFSNELSCEGQNSEKPMAGFASYGFATRTFQRDFVTISGDSNFVVLEGKFSKTKRNQKELLQNIIESKSQQK